MGYMGIVLSIAATVLAFILALLDRFSSKDHPGHNRLFLFACGVNFVIALGSIWFAYQSQSRQTGILTNLTKAQQELIQLQKGQLGVGNELASKLTKAQETTEQISTELTNNTRVVGNVLHQTARALEPLGAMEFLCYVKVPDTDPENQNIIRALEEGRALPRTAADKDRRFWQQPLPVNAGWFLLPDSPAFPKPNTALRSLLDSVQILLQFHSKRWPPSVFASANPPRPDLSTSFAPVGVGRELMLTPDHTFVLLAEGSVKPGQWSSTGVNQPTDMYFSRSKRRPTATRSRLCLASSR